MEFPLILRLLRKHGLKSQDKRIKIKIAHDKMIKLIDKYMKTFYPNFNDRDVSSNVYDTKSGNYVVYFLKNIIKIRVIVKIS